MVTRTCGPVDVEMNLLYSIFDPVKPHIDGLYFFFVLQYIPMAHLLSFWMDVAGYQQESCG